MDYMLSMIGYCVGLGNLWRFPYLCNRNGGGAFLIPFFFFLFVCGLPMFFLESVIGQFSAKGVIHVWDICPLFRGIGIGMAVVSMIIGLYYNMIIAWCLYYIIRTFASTLPWTTCTNWWNTEQCVEVLTKNKSYGHGNNSVLTTSQDTNLDISTVMTSYMGNVSTVMTSYVGTVSTMLTSNETKDTLSHTTVEEFWQYNSLRISSGITEFGSIHWHLVLCLLGAWFLILVSLIKGVKSVGKVVYVTATVPYIMLTILLVRGLTLQGSLDGIVFYLKPDFGKLLNAQVWVEACLQVFYSLGPGWGGIVMMSSYNKFNSNCLKDSVILTCVSEGTSVFAGLVIFAVLGAMAHEHGVHVSEVASSGPGLGFVAYPYALAQLPVPQLWSFIFFLMLLTAGLDTQFVNVEVVLTSVVDAFPKLLLKRRTLLVVAYCIIVFLCGLPMCASGGIYIFQLLDWYVGTLILILAIAECLVISWIYGFHRLDKDVEMMFGRAVPRIFKILLAIISPTILTMAAIAALYGYQPPSYGKYQYPAWCAVIGWTVAALPLCAIPIIFVKEIYNGKGSFCNRVYQSLLPSPKWLPNSPVHREMRKDNSAEGISLRKSIRSIFH